MTDREINLHPKNNPSVNLKPNIVHGNIPEKAVSFKQLDENIQNKIDSQSFQIAKNTADIAKNTADITKNTADITKNTMKIAKNTADITKNTADITKNTANIEKNTNNVASILQVIDVDTAKINPDVLQNSIDGSDDVIVDVDNDKLEIHLSDELQDTISTHTSTIAKNTADITKNTADITDLESKVSTLAVKVYNHDIALGTLNIENTSYSVENADSFAIPTTIGTNADVVIPKSRMALSMIKGKTEYSRNLADIALTDVASNEHISLNNETYFHLQNVRGDITLCFNLTLTTEDVGGGGKWQGWITLRDSDKNMILSRNFAYISFTSLNETKVVLVNFSITSEVDLSTSDLDFGSYYAGSPCRFKISNLMMVKGTYTTDTMPPFVPYYNGLKNVELNSLNVYGKTDNYTELHVGDKVTSVSTDLIKNATSVKSILPSSILPKTLASYERLEVVDNGDDTYKIDLVSHEPLINGNSYNSLWIGNPQGINAYSSIFSMKKPDETYLLLESVSSENAIYNRIRLTASDRAGDNTLLTSLLSNINELTLVASSWGNIPVFGGADNYASESTTNRNVVLKFSQSLTMNKINSSYENFDDNFRNGEETRATLIDGLSLDDVSAIIDTGDIVYAGNSNAEYDVSIAETSVELLVNKN